MIRNYFKTAWRNILSTLSYSALNLSGLTVALTCVLLVIAYIRFETSFDQYYTQSPHVYRLVKEDELRVTGIVNEGLVSILLNEFPEIEQATTFNPQSTPRVPVETEGGQKQLYNALQIDSNFLDVFNLLPANGTFSGTLHPDDVIITEKVAEDLFPGENPRGKTLLRNLENGDKRPYTIAAVIQDIPQNSHFQGDLLFVPMSRKTEPLSFTGYVSRPQYILVKPGTDMEALLHKTNALLRTKGMPDRQSFGFLPVQDIRLHAGNIERLNAEQYNPNYLYILGIIALLILVTALVNHINLSIARTIPRFKEMGVRKILGANGRHISAQLLAESWLFFLAAALAAFGCAYLSWPAFVQLTGIELDIKVLFSWSNLGWVFLIAFLCTWISAAYPLIMLHRKSPIELFRKQHTRIQLVLAPRKVLITLQFSIAFLLMVSTLIIHGQLQYLHKRSMGFEKDHLLVIPRVMDNVFKEELKRIPSIVGVGFAGYAAIGVGYGGSSSMTDQSDTTKTLEFDFMSVDYEWLETMKIELLQGRGFTEQDQARSDDDRNLPVEEFLNRINSSPIILTESTAKRLHIHSVDTMLKTAALNGHVIGIVKDIQLTSLKEEAPLLVLKISSHNGNAYIRIMNHDIASTLDKIRGVWQNLYPNREFNYQFADALVQQMYDKENRLARLLTLFAGISIALSSLGLLSLVALVVKQKTKEIGIRKVLGASVRSVTGLLARDFLQLVLAGILIGAPVAWWAGNKWLEDFANRIDIQWWMFVIAALAAIVIAMTTVGWQAFRAATANPVDSLKEE